LALPILAEHIYIPLPKSDGSPASPSFLPAVGPYQPPCELVMQRPTLQGVRIRSTRDALQVFNGVATSRLPLITRRLDAEERRAISPGNVYVWYVRKVLWRKRALNSNHYAGHRTGKSAAPIPSRQALGWSAGASHSPSILSIPC
jgi:hypothetical protein